MRSAVPTLDGPDPAPRAGGTVRALAAAALLLCGLGVGACRGAQDAPARDADATAVPALVSIGALEWYVDYDAALEVARRRDAPLWVHFGEDPG